MQNDKLFEREGWLVENLPLAYSAIALWPSAFVGLAMLWPGVPGAAAWMIVANFFGVMAFLSISGIVAVVLHACGCRPWQHRFSDTWFFWLQLCVAAGIVIAIARVAYLLS